MRTTKRTEVRLVALLIVLTSSPVAQAFYNPNSGRWLNRDPMLELGFSRSNQNAVDPNTKAARQIKRPLISEDEDLGLYAFARNDGIRRIDGLGLFCSDPCGDAYRNNEDQGDVGGVVCCGGRVHACVWGGNIPQTSPIAQLIIERCVQEHENDHLDDIDCPASCTTWRPLSFRPGKDPRAEECNAFQKEKDCLESGLADCGGDPTCEANVRDFLADTEANMNINRCQ